MAGILAPWTDPPSRVQVRSVDTREAGFTADFPGEIEHDRWKRADDILETKTETFSSSVEGQVWFGFTVK